jgi:hypothetical protein
MKELAIFSGDCFLGHCGEETDLKDADGKPLFVGDIVFNYAENYIPKNFTVVARDGFRTFTNGKIEQDINGKPFIMGIKNADLTEWNVSKVKDHSDCIAGEHWREFGFNYRAWDGDRWVAKAGK